MKITLIDVGKRFNRDWIFRHIHYEFTNGNSYAIIGPNGSGKSTLLQVIAGAVAESEGKLSYEPTVPGLRFPVADQKPAENNILQTEHFYQYISIAAPYLEVIEEMTFAEFLHFHQAFKPFLTGMDIRNIISAVGLEKAAGKQIRYYSSGMKQRVKLAQAFFSGTPIVLLDEPCTNLDMDGIVLYHQLIEKYCSNRILIVSSNDEQEFGFCTERISISDYKN
ncbi:MAG: ATP-binding cassette domain-containing protein [Bacteroidetes bacterium]|nr:ATP-binding cassette domain-containing protein [Bacteroidota bacterium]MBS1973819.1 ATP-binding cassette domain-containing protein [Bacteroidota bacterium]